MLRFTTSLSIDYTIVPLLKCKFTDWGKRGKTANFWLKKTIPSRMTYHTKKYRIGRLHASEDIMNNCRQLINSQLF